MRIAAVFHFRQRAVPGLVLPHKAHAAVPQAQPVHAPGVQGGNPVGIDVPRRGLLIEQAARLGTLLLQRQVKVGEADILNMQSSSPAMNTLLSHFR